MAIVNHCHLTCIYWWNFIASIISNQGDLDFVFKWPKIILFVIGIVIINSSITPNFEELLFAKKDFPSVLKCFCRLSEQSRAMNCSAATNSCFSVYWNESVRGESWRDEPLGSLLKVSRTLFIEMADSLLAVAEWCCCVVCECRKADGPN